MMIEGVILTPLKIINVQGGDVLHAMKCGDSGFSGFGEVYISMVELGAIKAWKRHRIMTLNLLVPVGTIRIVLFDNRNDSFSRENYQEVILSRKNYYRLTVPPKVWFGFQGIEKGYNLLLNVTDIIHDSDEVDRKEINEIEFDWSFN